MDVDLRGAELEGAKFNGAYFSEGEFIQAHKGDEEGEYYCEED